MICFVKDKRPISYNSKKKSTYQRELKKAFESYKAFYSQLPLEGELSSNIVYFYRDQKGTLDVDNLSKPFIDAFSGIIYHDDSQIKHRECSCVSLRCDQNFEINYSGLKEKTAKKLEDYINKGAKHILYFEVGDFSLKQVKIGGQSI